MPTNNKSINRIHHINKLKGTSLDAGKARDKIPTPIHYKGTGNIRDTRDIPQHNKVTLQEAIANINLNGEKLKVIPLKSGTRQGCPLSLHIYSIPYNS